MFSQIAIPTEHLERGIIREACGPKFAVKVSTPHAAGIKAAVAIDVIDSEESKLGLPTAGAWAAVCFHRLLLNLLTKFPLAGGSFLCAGHALNFRVVIRQRFRATPALAGLLAFAVVPLAVGSHLFRARLAPLGRMFGWERFAAADALAFHIQHLSPIVYDLGGQGKC